MSENPPILNYTVAADVIVAKPAFWYRAKFLAVGLGIVIYGLLSLYHGFVTYNRENDAARAKGDSKLPNEPFKIQFNQAAGFILPVCGVGILIRLARKSRGEYRLDHDTLTAPGHTVPLDAITRIDDSRWQRKGIASIFYRPADQADERVVVLDDYIFERPPTDAIFERIMEHVSPEDEEAEEADDADDAEHAE